ncbi:MAG: hypothetical protein QOD26_2889 [Betaproteobacteria bacterium]|jgi:hypothetical protein|nr:hypothetical protein [Betaproteobacteria bacterium]
MNRPTRFVAIVAILGLQALLADVVAQAPAVARYEDYYTFKNGKPYTLDPYIWAYTNAFAERFRMPKEWIDPGLKGALAVAWRMTSVGNINCGYGGKEENCWRPLDCQLDTYYDSSIELPWNYPDVVRDNLMPGISSAEFLQDLTDSKRMRRYVDKQDPNRPRGPMSAGGSIEFGNNTQLNNGPSTVVLFDRAYESGVALVSRVGPGVCPPKSPGDAVIRFLSRGDMESYRKGQLALKDVRAVHKIDLPESFLARLRPAYASQNKPNEDFMNNQIRQFFNGRLGTSVPTNR